MSEVSLHWCADRETRETRTSSVVNQSCKLLEPVDCVLAVCVVCWSVSHEFARPFRTVTLSHTDTLGSATVAVNLGLSALVFLGNVRSARRCQSSAQSTEVETQRLHLIAFLRQHRSVPRRAFSSRMSAPWFRPLTR